MPLALCVMGGAAAAEALDKAKVGGRCRLNTSALTPRVESALGFNLLKVQCLSIQSRHWFQVATCTPYSAVLTSIGGAVRRRCRLNASG